MVHKYSLFGQNIALDVESGSAHVLSDEAFSLIGDDGLTETDSPAYSELRSLVDDEALFSAPVELPSLPDADKLPLKALCLNIAHDCNMICEYCFASKGGYGLHKKLMSAETGISAMRFLMENSGTRKNLEVDFFGGEPLLCFDTVKEIVKATRILEREYGKTVRFTLTTNGTLLDDEKIDFINSEISNIVLSLDGTQSTNDRMRQYVSGDGVYSDIVPLYQKLVSRRGAKDYYVRGTFTRYNLDFAKDVIHLADLGFKHVSVEPVVAPATEDYSLREENLPRIFREYEILAEEIIRRRKNGIGGFNFFHFNIDLDNGPCVYKRTKGCGSGTEYLAFTPDGEFYPCHQFVGTDGYKLGDIVTNTLDRTKMKEFAKCGIATNSVCADCFAKYYCGGGCAANNWNFNKNLTEPYNIACEMEKKRVECAIAIIASV